jgi:hypothetical protein
VTGGRPTVRSSRTTTLHVLNSDLNLEPKQLEGLPLGVQRVMDRACMVVDPLEPVHYPPPAGHAW